MASILRDEAATLMHYGQVNFFFKIAKLNEIKNNVAAPFPVKNKMIYDFSKGPFFSENLMWLKKICQITILNLTF